MADDWETMDFNDMKFDDTGTAATAPDVSGASKAADKPDVIGDDKAGGMADDDWENMDFGDLTLGENAAAGHGMSEIRPAIERFATKGGADPLVFNNIADKELHRVEQCAADKARPSARA